MINQKENKQNKNNQPRNYMANLDIYFLKMFSRRLKKKEMVKEDVIKLPVCLVSDIINKLQRQW